MYNKTLRLPLFSILLDRFGRSRRFKDRVRFPAGLRNGGHVGVPAPWEFGRMKRLRPQGFGQGGSQEVPHHGARSGVGTFGD